MRFGMILVTALAADVARADEPAPEVPPAVVLFQEGRALLEAGNAAEACGKFEASYKLEVAAAGTMLNLGLCNEQLGKLATALKWFRRAQNRAAENNLTETEATAREKSATAAARVATLKLEVTAPAGRTVSIDGVKIDEVEFGRIEVDAGHYTLELVGPGAPTVRREVDVVDGKATTIQLVTAIPPEKKYQVIDLGRSQRKWSYLVGGVGAALIIGSGVIGIVGKQQYDAGESPKDWDHWKSVVRYGGSSLFVVGAATMTYAVVLRLKAPGRERREVVAPVIAPGLVGIALARPF